MKRAFTPKRDNCKDCMSSCYHAGKDREFICPGGVSCKVTITPERMEKAATDVVAAILTMAQKPENLENFQIYLSHHFPEWLKKYANTPEDFASEMKEFANMTI